MDDSPRRIYRRVDFLPSSAENTGQSLSGNLTGATKMSAEAAMAELFPGMSCPQLLTRLQDLLGFVRIALHEFQDGPVRQVVMFVLANPQKWTSSAASAKIRMTLRVERRDGVVFALAISGVIFSIDRLLAIVGDWTEGRPYDEEAFELYQSELNRLLAEENTVGSRVRVVFEAGANLLVYPGIGTEMIEKVALATTNELFGRYGLANAEALPLCLRAHFVAHEPTRHFACKAFMEALDQEAIASTARCKKGKLTQLGDVAIYNYFASSNAVIRRNRLQAATAFPMLVPMLLNPVRAKGWNDVMRSQTNKRTITRIAAAIDAGEPLFKTLADAFEVPVETIRWIVGKELPSGWMIDGQRMGWLFRMISWVAPEMRPANLHQFEQMMEAARAMSAPLQLVGGEQRCVSVLHDPRLALTMRRWLSERLAVDYSRVATEPTENQLTRDVADSRDFVEMLYLDLHAHCDLLVTVGDEADALQRFVLDWARTCSLAQFLAMSRRWHESLLLRTGETIEDSSVPQSWPPVLAASVALGGRTIVELVDTASLVEEGRRLQHCVGTYSDLCMRRDGLLFSLRDAAGNPCSTLQLRISDERPTVAIVQHRGSGNAAASEDCRKAADQLLALLNCHEFETPLRARQLFQRRQHLEHRRAHRTGVRHQMLSCRNARSLALELVLGRPVPTAKVSLPWIYAIAGVRTL
jgi:hypothetical protein